MVRGAWPLRAELSAGPVQPFHIVGFSVARCDAWSPRASAGTFESDYKVPAEKIGPFTNNAG
jgi:hypothetical protein